MLMNPTISIIVPVYNTEQYLNRCIDSILSQSFTNFELLLIDDGSTDKSGDICDEYARKDERIKVFHKKNGGVSSARNMGLDFARGEWITFVDADDWIVKDCLNWEYSLFQEDLIIFSYYNNSETSNNLFPINSFVTKGKDELNDLYQTLIYKGFFRTVWSKLFKKSIINNLRFDEAISIGEDHLFLLNYLCKIEACRFVDKPFYVHRSFDFLFKKYQIEISKAIYIMSSLFSVYDKLNVKNKNFEIDVFCEYKSFCQKYVDKNPELWYNNPFVKKIYRRVKSNLRISYRIRYKLMSFLFFSKMRNLLK